MFSTSVGINLVNVGVAGEAGHILDFRNVIAPGLVTAIRGIKELKERADLDKNFPVQSSTLALAGIELVSATLDLGKVLADGGIFNTNGVWFPGRAYEEAEQANPLAQSVWDGVDQLGISTEDHPLILLGNLLLRESGRIFMQESGHDISRLISSNQGVDLLELENLEALFQQQMAAYDPALKFNSTRGNQKFMGVNCSQGYYLHYGNHLTELPKMMVNMNYESRMTISGTKIIRELLNARLQLPTCPSFLSTRLVAPQDAVTLLCNHQTMLISKQTESLQENLGNFDLLANQILSL